MEGWREPRGRNGRDPGGQTGKWIQKIMRAHGWICAPKSKMEARSPHASFTAQPSLNLIKTFVDVEILTRSIKCLKRDGQHHKNSRNLPFDLKFHQTLRGGPRVSGCWGGALHGHSQVSQNQRLNRELSIRQGELTHLPTQHWGG